MKNAEIKEYLNTFPDDEDVSIILVNLNKRKTYKCVDVLMVSDMGQPVICIDIGKESNLDEKAAQINEKRPKGVDGQIDLSEYLKVSSP